MFDTDSSWLELRCKVIACASPDNYENRVAAAEVQISI